MAIPSATPHQQVAVSAASFEASQNQLGSSHHARAVVTGDGLEVGAERQDAALAHEPGDLHRE